MKILTVMFVIVAVAVAAQNNKTQLTWTDTTRDVFIDNELDRSAQVLNCDSPQRLALISDKLDSIIVLDITQHTVSTISKDAFKFGADRTSAISDSSAAMKSVGKFTRIDGPIYFFAIAAKPVLIRAHPGATGELTMEKLWETVPVWRSVMKNYEPDAKAVEAIKALDKETAVTLAFGTWCPDSKNYVPRLIKALRAAANDKIQIKLIGIDNQFHEPVAVVQPRRITNVPTVIVERGGHEIGRIVETPALKTMEEDLASILAGKQLVHNGRWDRGGKVASGTYSYRDRSGKQVGSEEWELFSTAEGGYLVHSRITNGGLSTEVFHRVDANQRPSFAEVTKLAGDDRTRTRFTIDSNTMTARTRGSVSGVITQTLELPQQFFLWSPAVAAQGYMQSVAGDRYQLSTYLTSGDFNKPSGTLAAMNCEARGEETIRVPAGEFRARHVTRKTDKETSEWWLHASLEIPVRASIGEREFVLTSLQLASAK
ncbi:MAG TPA: thioredoxin family protein [Blastocatellia bacterium]|nr:thioredoxin family protein [Blastocatellia bacterium]